MSFKHLVLPIAVLIAAPQHAGATGFFFAAEPIEVRSVLIDVEVSDTALHYQASVEVQSPADTVVWILPLPAGASLGPSAPQTLDALESASALQVILPLSDACPSPAPGASESGCGCGGSPPLPTGTATTVRSPDAQTPFTLRAPVGPSSDETEILVGVRSIDLISRLQALNVPTSSATRARLDLYFAQPTDALWSVITQTSGTRRLPTVSVDLPPESQPAIPLIATQSTAAPQLDLRILIRADTPFLPENWVGVVPPSSELVFDGQGRVNYSAWAARASAGGSGHFFATEAIIDTDEEVTTRLYARPAAQNLDRDPIFRPHPRTSFRVPAELDLSGQDSLQVCNEVVAEREPLPCAHIYCGTRSECLVVEGLAACRCALGTAGTIIDSAEAAPQLTCAALSARPSADVCDNLDCGAGTCVAQGLRPLCACEVGAVAVLKPGGLTCVAVAMDAPTYGPGGGPESRAARTRFAAMSTLSLFGLIGALWWSRRSRQGSH